MRARKSNYSRGGELIAQPCREDPGHRDGCLPDRKHVDARRTRNAVIEGARGQPRGIDRIDGGAIDALEVGADLGAFRQT